MRRRVDGNVRQSHEEWAQIIDQFRSSGQSGAAFCRKHTLPESSFEKWSKKIAGWPAVKKAAASSIMV